MIINIVENPKLYVDLVFRKGSLWIGAHYSYRNECYCINFIPFVTLRIGKTKYVEDKKQLKKVRRKKN